MKIHKTKEQESGTELVRETWDSWIVDLEDKEQPNCNIENQDECTNCGS